MSEERFKQILALLENNPNDSFLKYAAALEYKKHKQIDKSIELLVQLTSSNPEYVAAYYQLGKILEDQNKTDEAITTYRQGLIYANKNSDKKTADELREALMLLDADE